MVTGIFWIVKVNGVSSCVPYTAEAALIRLELTQLPRVFLPGETAEGQGKLAIVIREEDHELRELL